MEEHNSTHTLLSAQMKNLNVRLLLNLNLYGLKAGADRGFFLGGVHSSLALLQHQ